MKYRAASLFLALAGLNALAQGPGGPPPGGGGPPPGAGENIQSLAEKLAAVTARVAKLEGQIVAADLVGTYALHGFQIELHAGSTSQGSPSQVASYVFVGTVVLAENGAGSFTAPESGHRLLFGAPNSRVPHVKLEETAPLTWTYVDGTVTILGDLRAKVAAGGRVLILAFANREDGTNTLVILTRLQ